MPSVIKCVTVSTVISYKEGRSTYNLICCGSSALEHFMYTHFHISWYKCFAGLSTLHATSLQAVDGTGKVFVSGQIVNKYKYEENLQARRNKAPLWCRKWNPIDAALLNYAVIFSMNAYILSFCCCHISCACYIWLVLPKTKKRLENMTRQEFCLALSKPALI
jgi:hypothetical protein